MATNQSLKLQNTFRPNGRVFEVERSAAEHSAVVRMLLEDFDEPDLLVTIIPISIDTSDDTLAKVFEWATHHKNMPKPALDDDGDRDEVVTIQLASWDDEFFSDIDSETLYGILIATNYLDIKPLYDMAVQVVVNMVRGKSTKQIREILGITSDFTAEEEAAIRKETAWAYDGEEVPNETS
ncbi:Skp1 family, dimerization domain-containing protein [Chaetomidium leptoderma]|uniref:E3 ubiquitin ligase complex SCF subunit n=1 Tax=Chaetomidium leptoderma TaxID=669021 RepID=A0AAN6VQZ8_9PEZI|nr:Skp1 family, dimerization domain-containing protein [Chaetomidium leptoderma]